jgi:hypothetical protein
MGGKHDRTCMEKSVVFIKSIFISMNNWSNQLRDSSLRIVLNLWHFPIYTNIVNGEKASPGRRVLFFKPSVPRSYKGM